MVAVIETKTERGLAEKIIGRPIGWVALAFLLVGLVALFAVGLLGDTYYLYIGAMVAIYAIAVMGLDVFAGHGGQMSFGNNAFLGIGCYSTAYLTTVHKWPPLNAMLAGIVLSFIVAMIIGYPTLRLRGVYMITATMALGFSAGALAISLTDITGGYTGIAGIPAFRIGDWVFKGAGPLYWLSWGIAIVCLILITRLVNSRFGIALRTTGLDENVAHSLGINPHAYKLAAFCICSVMMSLAGSLLTHLLTIASPEGISFTVQTNIFTMLFIGGLGNELGIIVGAGIVVILPQALGFMKDYFPLVFGLLMLVILILRPRGLLAGGFSGTDWRAFWAPQLLRRSGDER